MGGYRLNTYVHAVELDAKGARTGRDKVFGPDDDMSKPENEWALAAITNDAVWADGNVPERKPAPPAAAREDDEVARLKARIAELEQAQASTGDAKAEPGYDDLSADELRAELESRELPKSGTKPELIARLRAADAAGKSNPQE